VVHARYLDVAAAVFGNLEMIDHQSPITGSSIANYAPFHLTRWSPWQISSFHSGMAD
jgi:hypothetical protein